ncbi:MAG: MBL fold metallo-hydrolase [Anaerolineae bacterium]|nr:MBL fold metallo-hydrolase [Anaerolineae bacterium]
MLFERIESEGLAHFSYLIGDQREAVVIDPRRDCDVYIDKATQAGYRITTVLETHRNEDYVIGSVELASRLEQEGNTVQIWHAESMLDYQYGLPAQDGQTWQIGRLSLTALHTPGHTPGHMSYLLTDPDQNPWVVFTGDALFAGDVGRMDLLGEEALTDMAEMLYDSLFNKLLPLGDEVIVCPAHGAGSVCGSGIAERVWTTIGLERKHSAKLQHLQKDDFLARVPRMLERPPYFRRMEQLNLAGAPVLKSLPVPPQLRPSRFWELARTEDYRVLDTRMELAFGAAHVPQALSIWQAGLASFAGWFLPYDKPLLLVTPEDDPRATVRTLVRLGYDNIAGTLAGGMLQWHMAGLNSQHIRTVTTHELCAQLDTGLAAWILDVRSDEEVAAEGEIPDAHHIHITQIPEHMDEVPQDQLIYIFCGSGLRSMVVASYLQRQGWDALTVVLGGVKGWDSTSCPLEL